jgi:sugar phosphate isomerase/epimerase
MKMNRYVYLPLFAALLMLTFASCASRRVARPVADAGPRYRIGVCDWMILKRQRLGAFALTSRIGADGLELDMGSLGNRVRFESLLDDAAGRQPFLDTAARYDLQFAAVAMSGFYAQDFARRPEYKELTVQAIETAKGMGIETVFLPMGVPCNPKTYPELKPVLAERLKIVGDLAAAEGITIAVNTSMPAADDLEFLKMIDSKGIRIAVNFSDIIENGLDIPEQLETWGRKNIALIHCSNTDGYWIPNDPALDMPAVKRTLDKMGWSGWLVVERSRDPKMIPQVQKNFSENVTYLKSIFQ